MGRTVSVPFRSVEYMSTTDDANFSATMFTLRPDYLGDVVASIAANFKLYRVDKLVISLTPPCGGTQALTTSSPSATYALGFTTIEPASAPGGLATMSQMPNYCEGDGFNRLSMEIPQSQLSGTIAKWFSVKSEGTDTTDSVLIDQGWIYVAQYTDSTTSNPVRVWVEFSGNILFRDPEDQSISLPSFGLRKMSSKGLKVAALKYIFDEDEKEPLPAADSVMNHYDQNASPTATLAIPPLVRQDYVQVLRSDLVGHRPLPHRT
jgi:hypothetical protein